MWTYSLTAIRRSRRNITPVYDTVEAHSCVDDNTDTKFLNLTLYAVDKDPRVEMSCINFDELLLVVSCSSTEGNVHQTSSTLFHTPIL